MASTTTLRQRFEELVRTAEAEVAENPRRYKLRLAMLAALGYGVIFALLTVLILILGGTIGLAMTSSAFLVLLFKKKLIVLVVVPIWVLARSLFVRVRAPEGYTLARKDYPVLWREIDGLRRKLGALPIHNVVLTPEMNAAVTQTPRLGLFGPYKNTLILGLELLMSLTPEQARAVLAHEFGHLSGSHGRFGNWIYRKRLTWARIQAAFDEQTAMGTGPIKRFMHWYVPRLAGYSFALARQQEYEADRVASQLTSPADMASALALCGTRDAITRETFWKPLLQRAIAEAAPETQTFSRLYHHIKSVPVDRVLVGDKVAAAMRVKTGLADTHPSLRDRLAAIGAEPVIVAHQLMAAEAWLGPKLGKVLHDFDADWLQRNREGWANRHSYAQAGIAALKELSARSANELTQQEAWQVAALTEEFMPEVDAIAAYCAYRAQFPDDRDADFVIGRLMLMKNNDAAGVPFLERAAENVMMREQAYGIIAAFWGQNERPDLSEAYLRRAEAAYDENVEARTERDQIAAADRFQPTTISPELAEAVARAVRASSVGANLTEICIAEKVVRRFPDFPVYVVLVTPKFFSRNKDAIGQTLAQEVGQSLSLPHTWFFLADTRDARAIAKKIKAVAKAV
jgi:Zn-dependent protease with chaperone function